ncbi:hypothetical protein GDO78_022369 [Eleutherodactylus coqui]|uniref:Uncharacterized protein n=1 Tax=Eleutherodactylus coqui TaxID=57060 RepID=A0A8J6EGM4_ELECQ|nr:hypothetical protein GDO78_022369 [Eleutherodactylus coqui]
MASIAKKRHSQTKIPYILTSASRKIKLSHSQDIAEEFGKFYAKLYNLKNDPSVYQPNLAILSEFLLKMKLHTVEDKMQEFNRPISEAEVINTTTYFQIYYPHDLQ